MDQAKCGHDPAQSQGGGGCRFGRVSRSLHFDSSAHCISCGAYTWRCHVHYTLSCGLYTWYWSCVHLRLPPTWPTPRAHSFCCVCVLCACLQGWRSRRRSRERGFCCPQMQTAGEGGDALYMFPCNRCQEYTMLCVLFCRRSLWPPSTTIE